MFEQSNVFRNGYSLEVHGKKIEYAGKKSYLSAIDKLIPLACICSVYLLGRCVTCPNGPHQPTIIRTRDLHPPPVPRRCHPAKPSPRCQSQGHMELLVAGVSA